MFIVHSVHLSRDVGKQTQNDYVKAKVVTKILQKLHVINRQ